MGVLKVGAKGSGAPLGGHLPSHSLPGWGPVREGGTEPSKRGQNVMPFTSFVVIPVL